MILAPGAYLSTSERSLMYFLTLPLVSVMQVIYTSNAMSKSLVLSVIHRLVLSTGKYGNYFQ
jgi:hypothetical protein